jgi:ATP-dependent Clp protease ATP-binding subunit ClpA
MNKIERFTHRARRVFYLSQEAAVRLNHTCIGMEHMLLGLLREEGSVAAHVLRALGVTLSQAEALVARIAPTEQQPTDVSISLSESIKRVLELAVDEARRAEVPYIGTEHLLLGLARCKAGNGTHVLKELGITYGMVSRQIWLVLEANPLVKAYRLTDRLRRVFQLAEAAAKRTQHSRIQPEHVLSVLAQESGCTADRILSALGVELATVGAQLEMPTPQATTQADDGVVFSKDVLHLLHLMNEEARRLGNHYDYIGTEHLLMALVRQNTNMAAKALKAQGVTLAALRQAAKSLQPPTEAPLTQLARQFFKRVAALFGSG